MSIAANLGFPRIGARRELKRALEACWAGTSDVATLQATARDLRLRHWRLQQEAGVTQVPSNDHALYDHVLDAAMLVGAVPARPAPMTVEWSRYAQSLTARPMKAMLTGPVTILQWSFVRDDQPRAVTCRQIALAIRDEVADLEGAGLRIIQIDEPAIREGLPLRREDWPDYLAWAVESFCLASSGVRDDTQIHTHMCYSEFHDILDAITAMDADVVSIETSRSKMELLDAFARFEYPNDIGPRVYDIHSPRVPAVEEMVGLLRRAAEVVDPARLWVNPDCGLKTRGWPEVQAALAAMVQAARRVRAEMVEAATVP